MSDSDKKIDQLAGDAKKLANEVQADAAEAKGWGKFTKRLVAGLAIACGALALACVLSWATCAARCGGPSELDAGARYHGG